MNPLKTQIAQKMNPQFGGSSFVPANPLANIKNAIAQKLTGMNPFAPQVAHAQTLPSGPIAQATTDTSTQPQQQPVFNTSQEVQQYQLANPGQYAQLAPAPVVTAPPQTSSPSQTQSFSSPQTSFGNMSRYKDVFPTDDEIMNKGALNNANRFTGVPANPDEQLQPVGDFVSSSGRKYTVHKISAERPRTYHYLTKNPSYSNDSQITGDPEYPWYASPGLQSRVSGPGPIMGLDKVNGDSIGKTTPNGDYGPPSVQRVNITPVVDPSEVPDQSKDSAGYQNFLNSLEQDVVGDFSNRKESAGVRAYRLMNTGY